MITRWSYVCGDTPSQSFCQTPKSVALVDFLLGLLEHLYLTFFASHCAVFHCAVPVEIRRSNLLAREIQINRYSTFGWLPSVIHVRWIDL